MSVSVCKGLVMKGLLRKRLVCEVQEVIGLEVTKVLSVAFVARIEEEIRVGEGGHERGGALNVGRKALGVGEGSFIVAFVLLQAVLE